MRRLTNVWASACKHYYPAFAAASSTSRLFTAPANVGPGRERGTSDAAGGYQPKHHWMLLMCFGCLAGGAAAAQMVEVDKESLPPMFSREVVEKEVLRSLEFRPDLAATTIRCAFVLAARRAGVTSTSIDESCAVTAGLEEIAGMLNYSRTLNAISMEDLTALAALTAVKFLGGPADKITYKFGRTDADKPVPKKPLPPGVKVRSFQDTLKSLGDLTDSECVALMACHAVGESHEDVSGVDECQRSKHRFVLGNHYFRTLLELESSLKEFEVPRSEGNRSVQHLPSKPLTATAVNKKTKQKHKCVYMRAEVEALLKTPSWRKWVEVYAKDKAAWEAEFQIAFAKLIDSNFTEKLRPYPPPEDQTKAVRVPVSAATQADAEE